MNRKNKAGFTLVELMVVAIIVAILAAVAIPLMTGNKNRAMATEAQAGLGTIRTAFQVYKAEFGGWPTGLAGQTMNNVTNLTVKNGDLAGKYFTDAGYALTTVTTSNYLFTATGTSGGDAAGKTVTVDQNGAWGGSLIQ
ncbi:MAG: prepilin-type N-terminal cleavage/methylation domain-containing protein [bacterium]